MLPPFLTRTAAKTNRAASVFLTAGIVAAGSIFILDAAQRIPLTVTHVVGRPEIGTREGSLWKPVSQDALIKTSTLRTDAQSTLDLRLSGEINLRVLGNTQVSLWGPRFYHPRKLYSGRLEKGALLAATSGPLGEKRALEIALDGAKIILPGGLVRIQILENGTLKISVLDGTAEISFEKGPALTLHAFEKFESGSGTKKNSAAPLAISDWKEISEAYLMIPETPSFHRSQVEIAREAGNFFGFAYDHGTFYTPGRDFCRARFKPDEGSKFLLEIYYDVFHPEGFAGAYFKTQDLDISRFQALQFEIRKKSGYPAPALYGLELKSKHRILAGTRLKTPSEAWQSVKLPLANPPYGVEELVLFFQHASAGSYHGALELRNFTLIPRDSPAPESAPKPYATA